MCGCLVASWIDFIFGDYIPSVKHYITLGFVLVNGRFISFDSKRLFG